MAETSTPLNNFTIRRITKTVLDAKQSVNANELILVDPEFTGGKLLSTDNTGNMVESNISSSDVVDAIDKKHTHSNKSILDEIPSSLGTAGQVLTMNSDATALEWSDVPTELPTQSSSTNGKVLTSNGSSASWEDIPTELPALTSNAGKLLAVNSGATGVEWVDAPTELPSLTNNASKILAVNSGATGVEWINNSGGGLSNYDFTHTANQTVSGSVTVTFAANQRGSQMITVSADIGITFDVRNLSDNYLWIKNTGSSDIDVTISSVVNDQTTVSNVYVPADGISVPAGGICEIGIVRNADGAFITSRNDLKL